jgi:hypothetical protein
MPLAREQRARQLPNPNERPLGPCVTLLIAAAHSDAGTFQRFRRHSDQAFASARAAAAGTEAPVDLVLLKIGVDDCGALVSDFLVKSLG